MTLPPRKCSDRFFFCTYKLLTTSHFLQKKRTSYVFALHNITQAGFLAFISQTAFSVFPKHTHVFTMLVFPPDMTCPFIATLLNSTCPLRNSSNTSPSNMCSTLEFPLYVLNILWSLSYSASYYAYKHFCLILSIGLRTI